MIYILLFALAFDLAGRRTVQEWRIGRAWVVMLGAWLAWGLAEGYSRFAWRQHPVVIGPTPRS